MTSKVHTIFLNVANKLVRKKIEEQGISLAILGGSVARGDEKEYSDIDINFFVNKILQTPEHKFYKFSGKFIEETTNSIKSLNQLRFPKEIKILYDSNNYSAKLKSQKFSKQDFLKNLKRSNKTLQGAQKKFREGDYEGTVLDIFGTNGVVFQLVHDLPNLFGLPFPSFRLLPSVKISAIVLKDKKIYGNVLAIYGITSCKQRIALRNLKKYEKIYKTVGRFHQERNASKENLGFYEPVKVKFNLYGLRRAISERNQQSAMRFMINSSITWSLSAKELQSEKSDKKTVKKLTLEILGINSFDKNFAEQKLKLTEDLFKRVERAIKRLK